MSLVISISRIVLPALAIFIFVKCLIALLFGRPRQNIYATLQNIASGKEFTINMWETSIGRAKNCDIIVDIPVVSRFHAVIARRVDGWYIYDLDSKNGIYINGSSKPINAFAKIENDDYISLGAENTLGADFHFFVDNDPIIRVSKKTLKQMNRQANRRNRSQDPGNKPTYTTSTNNNVNYNQSTNKNNLSSRSALVAKNGTICYLDGYTMLVGSSSKCNIQIFDPNLSEIQASIDLYEDGSWVISNISPNHDTYLNNVRVREPMILLDGDYVRFGDNIFSYTTKI